MEVFLIICVRYTRATCRGLGGKIKTEWRGEIGYRGNRRCCMSQLFLVGGALHKSFYFFQQDINMVPTTFLFVSTSFILGHPFCLIVGSKTNVFAIFY